MTLEFLQNYWWLLISVLGGLLVFLLFVQGGQSMLFTTPLSQHKELIVNCMGRKWELTFTTLVTFGGAFFASFPLFYSTSFGGAYWLWVLILFSFVLQAVSYEYRSKPGNVFGKNVYDIFLMINGFFGCVLLGVAVSMFFFGGDFSVVKGNILDGNSPVISSWAATHGFEAIFCWKNLVLGVAVFFLARTLASLYMVNNIADAKMTDLLRRTLVFNAGVFVVFFLAFVGLLLTATGYEAHQLPNGTTQVREVDFKYLHNYLEMWWVFVILLLGVVAVLYGIIKTIACKKYTAGIWWAGIGTFLVVVTLFWVAGYNDTAYYPSYSNLESSLTIRNSSSSQFTLTAMTYVSFIIPFVLAYIAYVWHSMDKKKLTSNELKHTDHKY